MATLAPSSPRLPSPPPAAEIQIGPTSPSMGSMSNRQAQQMEQTALDANAKRRIHPGTKAADMAAGPPLVPLTELDSAFQLQEHLAALHFFHTGSNTVPISRETAKLLTTPPPGIDRTLWLYELCRFLIEQCNSLIVGFLFDTPPCSAATCPEMRASEWQFLCAVHDQPKSCCAIDYCCHTLDWAANVVTNPSVFPSRFVALSDAHDKGQAIKSLVNVFRRLHRIFAHGWFQHRGVFWTVEGQTGLYVFFKTVCDLYDLLPGENFKLPPEAEGLEAPPSAHPVAGAAASDVYQHQDQLLLHQSQAGQKQNHGAPQHPVSILRPRNGNGGTAPADPDDDHLNPASSRTNTRRHIRSSPSTGSAVTTVIEADEDDPAGDFARRFRGMQIVDPAAAEDDLDEAEVPVIVEHGIPVRRISAAGVGGGAVPTSFAPIRIATPDKIGATETDRTALASTAASDAPNADSGGSSAASTVPKEGEEEESFLDSPDVETPVQGETQDVGAAAKEELAPAGTEPGKRDRAADPVAQDEEEKMVEANGAGQTLTGSTPDEDKVTEAAAGEEAANPQSELKADERSPSTSGAGPEKPETAEEAK